MSSNMEWSPDFCLSCDRQLVDGSDGAYCSQACRLAENEMERAGNQHSSTSLLSSSTSLLSSSTSLLSSSTSPLSSSASSTSSAGFHLPPAVNFSAYKVVASHPSAHYHHQPSRTGNYYASTTTTTAPAPRRQSTLTPSSSRSSLTYMTLSTTTSGISAHAASQLSDYARHFDQVREMKRRFT